MRYPVPPTGSSRPRRTGASTSAATTSSVILASSTIVRRKFHTFSARAIDPSGMPNRVPLFAPTKRERETRTSCMTISIENVSRITAGEEIPVVVVVVGGGGSDLGRQVQGENEPAEPECIPERVPPDGIEDSRRRPVARYRQRVQSPHRRGRHRQPRPRERVPKFDECGRRRRRRRVAVGIEYRGRVDDEISALVQNAVVSEGGRRSPPRTRRRLRRRRLRRTNPRAHPAYRVPSIRARVPPI